MSRITLPVPGPMPARRALFARRNTGARRQHRVSAIPVLLLGALAALWAIFASAQSTFTIYAEPNFTWNGFNRQTAGTPYESSLAASFADVQAAWDYCDYLGNCYTLLSLHPDNGVFSSPPIEIDGVPFLNDFNEQVCSPAGGCTVSSNAGFIQLSTNCPGQQVGQVNDYGSLPAASPIVNQLRACPITIQTPPPPHFCLSCLGDPIYASTGQLMQAETDYSGLPGLNFTRTYWSNNGYFASQLTQGFLDGSAAAGTTTPSCYPSYYIINGINYPYCYPYISLYPNVNNGVAQYALQTAEGRWTQFTGPNNAVTQNADINDRITPIFGGWQVKREDDSTETYSSGQLIQKTLRGGKSFTYTYSTSSTPASIAPYPGLLLSQSDAFGHSLTWSYNSSGQMSQMTDPAGGTYQYSYDLNGNLVGVSYPDGSAKAYSYNQSTNAGTSLLTGITDESGVLYTSIQYQSQGPFTFAVNTQHAGGVDSYTFTYPAAAYYGAPISYTTVVDPLGTQKYYLSSNLLSYNVDTIQYQPAESGSGYVSQTESYDANGNPASVTDFNGNVTTHIYDLTRNLETSRTEAYGTPQARTITTVWDANWRQPDLITEPNRTTAFSYDNLGNVLTKTITDTTVSPNVSRTWTYTYDSYGRMLSAKGPRTDVNSTTTYTYYTCTSGFQCGQVQTITDALGHVTTFNTYDAHGQPLSITDPNGVVTTLTYDLRQRLLSRQIGTETTSYAYYPTGLLKTVTLPDSSTVSYSYDGAHRLTNITDGAGNTISYTLDNMGNRIAENSYDPSGNLHRTHTRVFNALNDLYQDINAAGTSAVTTTLAYDNDGNVLSSAAPLGRNTADQYDALNRLINITDPNSGVTQLGYDANDNLASVTDPRSLTTTYTHNGFGDVTGLVSPDTGTSTSTYDSGGNLKTATDARGAQATYSYDALNRVTQVAYTDEIINFTYDTGTNGIGRLTGASDANHSMSWVYDAHGRVTGKGQTVGSVTKSVGYAYTNGDLVSLVTPSGQTIRYSYNSNHQVTGITVNGTTLLSNVTYEPFGQVNGWIWGNGTAVTRSYDTDGKIASISSAGTKTYGYDNAFRITSINDTESGASNWTYGYDLLDRLTSAAGAGNTYGWTYDANGNRLTQSGTFTSTYNISSTSNQIVSITGTNGRNYSYDAAGNTLGYNGKTSFTYNNRGRMIENANTTTGVSSPYVYNALGQLIETNLNTVGIRLFWYDEAGHYLGVYNGSGGLGDETVWLGDIPVATIVASGHSFVFYYIHTDHLNTPRQATLPGNNSQMYTWFSDPFGTTAQNQNPQGNGTFNYPPRFPGQVSSTQVAGVYQNGFRDYDPQMGRYIEPDPLLGLTRWVSDDAVLLVPVLVRWPKWLAPYVYVTNNPISEQDSFGMGPLSIIKCLWYGRQIAQAAAKCKTQCPDSIEGTIDFIQKYTNDGSLDSAMLKCTCKAIGSEKCAKWLGACAGVAIMAPYKPL